MNQAQHNDCVAVVLTLVALLGVPYFFFCMGRAVGQE
jgi:hypothetical protein